jgi:4-hydroxy-tetrahydrodipicolinate synthase
MEHFYENYKGVVVPMATPVDAAGDIDAPAAGKLINYLLDHQAVPFIMGTNGEASSLSLKNRTDLVSVLVDHRRSGIPLIAGVIGLPFTETIEQSNAYFMMGVDAVVLTLPNYFGLNNEQMLHYFRSVSERVNGNVILYNIPKTIHMSIPVEVIEELSHEANIIGIKDSEFDEERLDASLSLWKDRHDFFHLTGVNKLMVKGMLNGSRGIVPSTGNFDPGIYHDLYRLCLENRQEEATALLAWTQELCDIYQEHVSLADSLAGLKVVLAHLGLCTEEMLPPLMKASPGRRKKIIEKYQIKIEG